MAKQTINTTLKIGVPIERAWSVLTDFHSYPEWNPFVRRIEGLLEPGEKLAVDLQLGGRVFTIHPSVAAIDPGQAFSWVGGVGVPGLLDGTHWFRLLDRGAEQCRFVHGEAFDGLFTGPVLWAIGERTESMFEAMNKAFKARCEERLMAAQSTL